MKYLIWSFEHEAWWGPNHCGYTTLMEKAGRYSKEEAGEIHTSSIWLEEVAIAEPVAIEKGPPEFSPWDGRQ